MKISFIIPIYKKTPEQLRNCIKSLFAQSYKDIEVLCVFDGDDVELQKVANEFQAVKTIVIEHGGACRARNEGAKLATGDLLSFWDADCYAEPEMAAMWIRTFEENADCDFVYSGYRFTNQQAGHDAEPFDPFTLEKYNYISSMFPIKKDKFPGWDESLSGLQDWDYWRRIVKSGSKGKFIPGYGFVTDMPVGGDISFASREKVIERIRSIREKHEDTKKDILVCGTILRRDSTVLAKALNADYFPNWRYWKTEDYKLAIMIGFHPQELMENASVFGNLNEGAKRAIYWTGFDADEFAFAPYVQAKTLLKIINECVDYNFCMDDRAANILETMGIKAEVLTFPREPGEQVKEFPEDFKVLAWSDDNNKAFVSAIVKALPDIHFDIVRPDTFYKLPDYSVVLQFTNSKRLEAGTKNALMLGRRVISNVKEPYAGYVEVVNDATDAINQVVNSIRDFKKNAVFNDEAASYYMEQTSPEKFKARIYKCIKTELEVVS